MHICMYAYARMHTYVCVYVCVYVIMPRAEGACDM